MCDVIRKKVDGEWHMYCQRTRKPITIVKKNGMYCDDLCDMIVTNEDRISAFFINLFDKKLFGKKETE